MKGGNRPGRALGAARIAGAGSAARPGRIDEVKGVGIACVAVPGPPPPSHPGPGPGDP